MKTNRQTPRRPGGSDRRGTGSGGSSRNGRRGAAGSVHRTRRGKAPAPAREGRTPQSGPQTSPILRPVDRPARATSTSQAKARAKARKAKAPKTVRPGLTERLATRLAAVDLRPLSLLGRVPFVVLVIGALGLGLGLTLWLSTASAERSYQLGHARERNRLLQQQKESLERDVREAQSAPALAEAARKQGMIPTRDTAHLIQDPAGNWVVVGTPKPADGVPPPPLNAKLPDEGPSEPRPGQSPEVPVRIEPPPGDPAAPARTSPEMLLRVPDGSATVGGQHLSPQLAPPPGLPGESFTGQPPGVAAPPGQSAAAGPTPGLPAPGAPLPAPVPAEVPAPMGGLPAPAPGQFPAPGPAEVPVPPRLGTAPEAPQAAEPIAPGAPAPRPGTAGGFAPPAAVTPGMAG